MKVLFLCVGNSARSQMAEGLAKKILDDHIEVGSAGSKPTGIHPMAIQVMAELGIDISKQTSKSITSIDLSQVDYIITLCAEEVCPYVPAAIKKEHWPLPDPARFYEDEILQIKNFREVRDKLKQLISALKFNNGKL